MKCDDPNIGWKMLDLKRYLYEMLCSSAVFISPLVDAHSSVQGATQLGHQFDEFSV